MQTHLSFINLQLYFMKKHLLLAMTVIASLGFTSCEQSENLPTEQTKLVACELVVPTITTDETDSPLTRIVDGKRLIKYAILNGAWNGDGTPLLAWDGDYPTDGAPYSGWIEEGQAFKIYLPENKEFTARFAHQTSYQTAEKPALGTAQNDNVIVIDPDAYFCKETLRVGADPIYKEFTLNRVSSKFVAKVGVIPTDTYMKVTVYSQAGTFHWLKDNGNRGSNAVGEFTESNSDKSIVNWSAGTDYAKNCNPNFKVYLQLFKVGGEMLLDTEYTYNVEGNIVKTVTYNFSGSTFVANISDAPMNEQDETQEF